MRQRLLMGFSNSTPQAGDEQPAKRVSKVDPRILFANERTLLAWVRTGLALTGFGFVIARFGIYVRKSTVGHDTSLSLVLGVVMILLGAAVQVGAIRQHVKHIQRLRDGEIEFEPRISPIVLLAAVVATMSVVVILFILLDDF
ncbi:MAG TPA: DUF202 domain-containing protein [Fimbriimonas sp.]